MQVWSDFTAFAAGHLCRSHCGSTPCNTSLSSLHRPLKLSILLHSANLRELDSPPSSVRNTRPFVSIRVGDGLQQTEQGDWSEEFGEWRFGQAITVEASAKDEISITVSSCMCYELYFATIPILTDSICLGVLSVPVDSVLRQLQLDDRDADGMVYATPVRALDIIQGRHLHGSLRVSFETRSAPARCVAEEFNASGYGMAEEAKALTRSSQSPQPLPLHAGVDQLPLDWWKQFSTEVDAQTNGNLSRSPGKGPTLPLWAQPHPAPWARGARLDTDRSREGANDSDTSRHNTSRGRRLSAPPDPGQRTDADDGVGPPTTPVGYGTRGCSGRWNGYGPSSLRSGRAAAAF